MGVVLVSVSADVRRHGPGRRSRCVENHHYIGICSCGGVVSRGGGKCTDFAASLDDLEHLRKSFQRDFRLTPKSFVYVYERIRYRLESPLARGNKPTPGPIIMATALWYLATGSTYREITCVMRNGLSETSTMPFALHYRRVVCVGEPDDQISYKPS